MHWFKAPAGMQPFMILVVLVHIFVGNDPFVLIVQNVPTTLAYRNKGGDMKPTFVIKTLRLDWFHLNPF